MHEFTVTLERKISKRSDKIKEQIDYIVKRGVAGSRKVWNRCRREVGPPVPERGGYRYIVTLTFQRGQARDPKTMSEEAADVVKYMEITCKSGKFKPPWEITKVHSGWETSISIPKTAAAVPEPMSDHEDVVDFDRAVPIENVVIPDVLLHGSDEEIENYEAFSGIYGRAKHIRLIAASIKRMQDTKGEKRNHLMLWGAPACAKTQIFRGWMKVLGRGSFFSINANSATRAGIELIFLNRFKKTGTPPIVFIEEMEKTKEEILSVWLSIMDDRAEVRKVTYKQQDWVEAKVLCFSTVNDKVLFDRLHGGRPGHPGALSSRFTKQLYVPRPDIEIMRRILARDIELYGGRASWIEPCLEIAHEIRTTDPRIILSFLDGQDRLLDGSYKADILGIFQVEREQEKGDSADVGGY